MSRGSSSRLMRLPVSFSVFVMVGVAMFMLLVLFACLGRCGLDGIDDVLIAGAAADIAFDAVADLVVSRIGIALDDLFGGHDHARSAEAALGGVLVPEGILHGIEAAVFGESFDGEDIAAVGLDGEHGATLDGLAVHVDSASAAQRGFAADVGTGESNDIAEVVNEEQSWLDGVGMGLPIDG